MNKASPKSLLKMARELRGWSQSYVAEQIGAPASSYVSRWERGITFPSPYYRVKLCVLFGMNTYELGLLEDAQEATDEDVPGAEGTLEPAAEGALETCEGHVPSSSLLWNVPYRRNPFFTGREAILTHLHDFFAQGQGLSLFALSGLPGIGKTQTAVEYAYRYLCDYQAVIWIRADSQQTLLDDFCTVAQLLQLLEREEQNTELLVNAVKHWFEKETRWLLILDNVGDVETMYSFLPQRGNGDILLTTRMRATGSLASGLELDPLNLEDGKLFLLRRTKLLLNSGANQELLPLSTHNDQAIAEVAQLLGGLPLALDQAGAYIEETLCNFLEYFRLYQEYSSHLLQRRGRLAMDHPESVATTLLLCIEKIQRLNPTAADLLYICAFLDAEAIPEELFIESSPLLSDIAGTPILLNEIFSDLLSYSFLRRDSRTRTFTIHRVVQSILRDFIAFDTRLMWATRVVKVLNKVFPAPSFSTWPTCQRYLMHGLVCAQFIEDYHLHIPEAAHLLYHVGCYLLQRVNYEAAEHFLQQALHIYEQLAENSNADVAACLHMLATLSHFTGKTEQGKALLQQAIHLYELNACSANRAALAECLNDLAMLSYYQQSYDQAEQYVHQALDIWEQTLEEPHPDIAGGRNNLAKIYVAQGKSELAEPLFQQALATLESTRGVNHPDVAFVVENLARLYRNQGKYAHAESFYNRAIAIREEAWGKAHPRLAETLEELATLYRMKKKYAQAERLYKRALDIWEDKFGAEHPKVAAILQLLVQLYTTWGKHYQAEVYRQQLPAATS